jgi:hypothetical protein
VRYLFPESWQRLPALLKGELADETHGKQVGLAGIEPAT